MRPAESNNNAHAIRPSTSLTILTKQPENSGLTRMIVTAELYNLSEIVDSCISSD